MTNLENFADILETAENKGKKIYEICQLLESENTEKPVREIRERVKGIISAMKSAINAGLQSDEKSAGGMCGDDCAKLVAMYKNGKSLFGGLHQKILKYSLATVEQNARMGKIAACPTAGSCGIVPSVIIAVSEELEVDEEREADALITAGLIGKIVSNKLALAGAVAGCQSECGVASAMAASAIVELYGGTNEQIINAAALTLKNIMGLVCDPVAGLVEIPCVKRNAFLSIYAVVGAELALAGIKSVIPVDEVVDAMKQVGEMMSPKLKESSEAGLATTPTGIKIAEELSEKWNNQ